MSGVRPSSTAPLSVVWGYSLTCSRTLRHCAAEIQAHYWCPLHFHGRFSKMERWKLNPVINPDYLAWRTAGAFRIFGTLDEVRILERSTICSQTIFTIFRWRPCHISQRIVGNKVRYPATICPMYRRLRKVTPHISDTNKTAMVVGHHKTVTPVGGQLCRYGAAG